MSSIYLTEENGRIWRRMCLSIRVNLKRISNNTFLCEHIPLIKEET